jgi:acetylornithine/succinyldiaminopimelate/putrescine aminotransferase
MGRTGTFLASEGYGIKADVVTLAKGLSGGVPVGAVLAGEKTADVLGVGDHGSTFGGNPLAAAAGLAVLSVVDQKPFLAEIKRQGDRMMDTLKQWNHPRIQEVRGRGLMIGVDLDVEAWPVLERLISQGLLLLSAGPKTLRFLPPYIFTDEEIDEGLAIVRRVLDSSTKVE